MGRHDAWCTKAITALLISPLVAGDANPITRIRIEKKRPNLCLRRVTNATKAAHVCINIDENNAHRNIWYHISLNVIRGLWERNPKTLEMGSSSSELPALNNITNHLMSRSAAAGYLNGLKYFSFTATWRSLIMWLIVDWYFFSVSQSYFLFWKE